MLLHNDAKALRLFERKVRRKIFGPVRGCDDFCIRCNSELNKLLNDMDMVLQRIKMQRMRWLGHVVRIKKNAPTRKEFHAEIYGSLRRERQCIS